MRIEENGAPSSFESMTALMDAGSHTFRFVVIYRIPPSSKNKLQKSLFLQELADLLELTTTLPGRLVLLGDFNVHWDSVDDAECMQLSTLLDDHGLVQHVRSPTHQDGHILDLIITRSVDNLVAECRVGEFMSDHNALHVSLNCCKAHPPRRTITYRSLKSINTTNFACSIMSSSLSQPPPASLDDAAELFHSVLEQLMDEHAPLKKRTVVDRPLQSWINEDILSAKRERRKAEGKWKQSGLVVHKLIYKDLCIKVKDLVSKAKAEFYIQKIRDCEGDQKRLYRIVDGLLGREKPRILPVASCDLELAELFNSYFTTKIANIREDLVSLETTVNEISFENLESLHKPWSQTLDTFRPTDVAEVTQIIKKSSPATCQLDPIPTSLVISFLPQLAPYISHLVNIAFQTGSFPVKFKSAIVHPLIKKPNLDAEILKNYRPVSNLSFVSKIIERVVASRILDHMRENDLLEPMQSAYRQAHSTETALLRVQNDILTAVDEKKCVFLVLLDLSAAFDTVDHNLLLSFLELHVGLTNTALGLLRDYLCDRSQRVSINGVLSELSKMAYGVPQGSVLGPILFSIYTLPLGTILRHHGLDYHMYADDTQIMCTSDFKTPQANMEKVRLCVSDIRTWMIRNKLKINDSKTEFLLVQSKYTKSDITVELLIGQSIINQSDSCRNLGVMFDRHMNFDCQISTICRSANFHLRNIGAVRKLLPDFAAEQLVHALVTSRLDYCNSLLYGLQDYMIIRLQRIQNTAARIVACSPKSFHITPILYELHWLPVEERILFKLLLTVYKCVNNIAPVYLCELVKPLQRERELRSSTRQLLDVPSSRLKYYGDRAFSVCGPREWNILPLHVKQSPSVNSFKSKLKTYLFKKHFGETN